MIDFGPSPAPGGLGKGPSRGPARFVPIFSPVDIKLGGIYGRILDFSLGGRREKGHEMVFELVSGADFRCVLHHF